MKPVKVIIIALVAIILLSSVFYYFTFLKASPTQNFASSNDERSRALLKNADESSYNIVSLGEGKYYVYSGKDVKNKVGEGNISGVEALRKLLEEGKAKYGSRFVVLVKANETNFKETVATLDEMTINKISNYALFEMNKEEETLINTIVKKE